MIRANKKTIKRATIQKKEKQLIARAAAAGGKMEVIRYRGGKYYAVYPADQIELDDPIPCKTLQEAEQFITIDEFLQEQG